VPLEELQVRPSIGSLGKPDPVAGEWVIRLAVLEVLFELVADEEAVVWSDGDVAAVEEPMDVGAEEKPVVDTMLTSLADRANVRSLEDRESLLLRYRAAAFIGVGDNDPKASLAEPWTN